MKDEIMDHIDVVEFARTRGKELLSLTHHIKAVNGDAIPSHLRRRAGGHRRRRKQPRRRNVTDSKSKVRQLDSHKWHAKRMHMEEIWGYKLPINSFNKGLSGDLKICQGSGRACVVHDASYFSFINMEMDPVISSLKTRTILITALKPFLEPNLHIIEDVSWLGGKKMKTITLYELDSFPYNCIGPVETAWILETNSNKTPGSSPKRGVNEYLQIRVHPAITKRVVDVFNRVLDDPIIVDHQQRMKTSKLFRCTVLDQRDNMNHINLYKLRGKNSINTFICSLNLLNIDTKYVDDIGESLERMQQGDIEICSFPVTIVQPSTLPMRDNTKQSYIFIDVLMSKTNHKCGGLDIYSVINDSMISTTTSTTTNLDKPSLKHQQFKNLIFHKLVLSNACAIGLNSFHSIETLMKNPVFPRDYIDTTAGSEFHQVFLGERRKKEYFKKPKGKRSLYHMCFLPRFTVDWSVLLKENMMKSHLQDSTRNNVDASQIVIYRSKSIDLKMQMNSNRDRSSLQCQLLALVPVQVTIKYKGTLQSDCMICRPTDEDVGKWIASGGKWAGISSSSVTDSKRDIIGFVTSAVEAHGIPSITYIGVGMCSAASIVDVLSIQCNNRIPMLKSNQCFVLIRSVSSKQYRSVIVTLSCMVKSHI